MKILHKYVLKEHLGPLVFAMTALTSLLLLQYIAKRFGELVGKGLPWSVIGEFLVLSVPLTVALSLPMAVLVATLYAFSRLAAENEITAMKASGTSIRNVLTPVLWAAAGVTLFMVAFNDQVLPRANHKLRSLQGDIAQKKPTFALREQVINEVSPGRLYLRSGRLSQTSNVMREITIYDVGDATRRRTIYADSGNMAMSPDHADLQLTLYSGTVNEVPTDRPDQLQRLYFNTQLIRVSGVGNQFQKTSNDNFKGEREMSVCEMERNAVDARRRFVAARKEFREKVALARERKVKLSKDVLETPTTAPVTVGVGSAYCSFLTMLGVKALIAQEPVPQNPPPPPQRPPAAPPAAQNPVPRDSQARDTTRPPVAPEIPVLSPTMREPVRAAGATPQRPTGGLVPAPGTVPLRRAPENLMRGATPAQRAKGLRPGTVLPDTIPASAIPNEIIPGQVEGARLRVMDTLRSLNRYDVEIQKKFALAAACFIFVLLGAPIALRFPRAGVGLTIGVSLVVFGLYYVGLIAGESLARRGLVPPFVSMWIANAVFGLIALILLARMGKESGTSRGGDMRELIDSIRHRFRRRRATGQTPRNVPRTSEL